MSALAIITPLHEPGNRYLGATYRSLCLQTFGAWEWHILENHGGRVPAEIRADRRVHVHAFDLDGVGALKRKLCRIVATPWIVELDADDLLVPTALERIAQAFERGADFVYSDFAEFQDGTWQARRDDYPYDERFGWRSYPVTCDGHDLVAMSAPPVTAHNLRLIEWCPNHVRAWTKAAYDKVGGHDSTMLVADDHDLIVRFFLAGCRFEHVPECLYLYRTHASNTVVLRNAAIRDATQAVYNRCIWPLAEHWSASRGLRKVDLCGGVDAPAGYLALDRHVTQAASGIACDLDQRWPLDDGSVGLLRAHDAIEHLVDPIHTMNEAYRVLAPGGFLMIHVPSTNGQGAFCDPTHRSFWNRLSFRYYTDKNFTRYLSAYTGRFQVSRIIEWFPSEAHRADNIPYVEAHLFAIKDGYRPMGEICC